MASDIPPNSKRLLVTPALNATFLVLLLSLATWYFFYMRSMPLSPGDIAVVVVLWLIVVIAARWIVGRVAPDRKKSRKIKKKLRYSSYRAARSLPRRSLRLFFSSDRKIHSQIEGACGEPDP